jgi:hypothetical protein
MSQSRLFAENSLFRSCFISCEWMAWFCDPAARFPSSNAGKIKCSNGEIETPNARESLGANGIRRKQIQDETEAGCDETSSRSRQTWLRCACKHSERELRRFIWD